MYNTSLHKVWIAVSCHNLSFSPAGIVFVFAANRFLVGRNRLRVLHSYSSSYIILVFHAESLPRKRLFVCLLMLLLRLPQVESSSQEQSLRRWSKSSSYSRRIVSLQVCSWCFALWFFFFGLVFVFTATRFWCKSFSVFLVFFFLFFFLTANRLLGKVTIGPVLDLQYNPRSG